MDLLKSGLLRATCVVVLLACLEGTGRTADEFPLTFAFDAKASSGATTISSIVTIRLDRPMLESRLKRVTDALIHGGYPGFLTTLRTLPPIGTIEVGARSVEIRYSREQADRTPKRWVMVADKPLFFAGSNTKPRAGYELTVVEILIDADGKYSGKMAGAARVKNSPDGVILDDFAEVPVQLEARR